MIFNTILILIAVAATAWVALIGFTTGWTLKLVGSLLLGLLAIIAGVDAPRRWKRKQSIRYKSVADLGQGMTSDFKVKFGGNKGRCLTYEDGSGTLLFDFDFAMPDGKSMIIYKASMTGDLKKIPSILSGTDQSRLQLAFERVKQYAVSSGYKLSEKEAS